MQCCQSEKLIEILQMQMQCKHLGYKQELCMRGLAQLCRVPLLLHVCMHVWRTASAAYTLLLPHNIGPSACQMQKQLHPLASPQVEYVHARTFASGKRRQLAEQKLQQIAV